MVMSASFMSGSDCPKASIIVFLLTGEARLCVISTNNLPPALQMPSRMLCSGGEQESRETCLANLWAERRGNYQTDHEAGLVLARNSVMCKRISCIVAQTIVRQLVSVVNTSI